MNALTNYYNWLSELDPKKKEKYQFIMIRAYDMAYDRKLILSEQFDLRMALAFGKYKDFKEFVNDELFKASEELTRVDIDIDWTYLNDELLNIKKEIKTAMDENRYKYYIDHDEESEVLFHRVFIDAVLVEEYLNSDIDLENPPSWGNIGEELKDFNKVVELIGRYFWIVYLLNLVASNLDKKEVKPTKNFPPLPECFVNGEDFNKYFHIPQIKDLYDVNEKGLYYLKQGKKAFLSGLAHTLKNKGKLSESIKTSQDLAKVFCSFFHVPFNKIEEKQFQPDRARIEYFNFIK